ncbi:hypothetical protein H9P43_000108 [Blastocladiella emersonii ATCC 22665]|nr:hypothetical protein H9P43_000108 [Blastocladiella emersonii ATCC 22665]
MPAYTRSQRRRDLAETGTSEIPAEPPKPSAIAAAEAAAAAAAAHKSAASEPKPKRKPATRKKTTTTRKSTARKKKSAEPDVAASDEPAEPHKPAAKRRRKTGARAPPAAPREPAINRMPTECWALILEHLTDASSIGHLLLCREVSRTWRDLIETRLDRVRNDYIARRLRINKIERAGIRLKSGRISVAKPRKPKPAKRARKSAANRDDDEQLQHEVEIDDLAIPTGPFNTVMKHVRTRCMVCGSKAPAKSLMVWGDMFQLCCVKCRVRSVMRSNHPGTPITKAQETKTNCVTRMTVISRLGVPAAAFDAAHLPYREVRNPVNRHFAPMKLYNLEHVGQLVFAVTGNLDPIKI